MRFLDQEAAESSPPNEGLDASTCLLDELRRNPAFKDRASRAGEWVQRAGSWRLARETLPLSALTDQPPAYSAHHEESEM